MKLLLFCSFMFCVFWGSANHQLEVKNISEIHLSDQDSLQNLSYKQLEEKYYLHRNDHIDFVVYAKTYLAKAKKEKNALHIANGYNLLAKKNLNYPELGIAYCDSILQSTKEHSFLKYPTRAYLHKGTIFLKQNKLTASLNAYLKGLEFAQQKKDSSNIVALRHNIALIKIALDQLKDAEQLFKENLRILENSQKENYFRSLHIGTLLRLSGVYNRKKQPDTSLFYSKMGLKLSLQEKPHYYREDLLISQGISHSEKKKYSKAIEIFSEVEKIMGSRKSLDLSQYLGVTYLKIGKQKKGVSYLKRFDSLVNQSNYRYELATGLIELLSQYKKQGLIDEQIQLMEKIIRLDSIEDIRNKKLKIELDKNYDAVLIEKEKRKLIHEIQTAKKKKNYTYLFVVLGCLIILLALGMIAKKKKQQYDEQLEKEVAKLQTPKNERIKKNELVIKQEIVDEVLNKLKTFEEELHFLQSDLTLSKTAKKLKTNSTYLSKIINEQKQKSFSNYINDLRISHCIHLIDSDPKFRKYSMKSLAQEVGFNNLQSFVSAFKKSKQANPTEFFNNLQNK